MIAVIADDFTGAVEIAGVGLRYGLTVEIVTAVKQTTKVELLVVTTNTRSMPEQEAVKTMADITAQLKALNPQLIYKKVDSVLRGHIIAELKAQLTELDLNKALLLPANPALNRIITNGNYFVNGQPIHLSSFADDPEFAITSTDVHTMLRDNKNEVTVQTTDDVLTESGITLGECISESDLKKWAGKADRKMLLAGGSGFFAAILESLGYIPQPTTPIHQFEKPALFISGTTFDKSRQMIQQLKEADGPVSYMPQDIVTLANPAENLYEKWADEVVSLLNVHQKAVVAIHESAKGTGSLSEKKALLVEKVLKRIAVKELLIEGGATGAAIIKQLGFDNFTPSHEFSTGVIRMNVVQKEGLFLTLKPGSYNWPAKVWDF